MTQGIRVQHLLRERVAEEVRALLARKMMTGAELAEAIGRSPMYVSRRVRGEVAFDLDDMQRLAEVFGVEVSALLPKGGGAGSSLKEPYVPTTRSVDPLKARPVSGGPFSGGRRDSTRPVSSVPAARRRPRVVSTQRRPKAA